MKVLAELRILFYILLLSLSFVSCGREIEFDSSNETKDEHKQITTDDVNRIIEGTEIGLTCVEVDNSSLNELEIVLRSIENVTYRSSHQDYFCCTFLLYKLNRIEDVSRVVFKVVYNDQLGIVESYSFDSHDIDGSIQKFKENPVLEEITEKYISKITPNIALDIFESFRIVKNMPDTDYDGDFYSLLGEYSSECSGDIKKSKPKKYVFLTALFLREAELEEGYFILKDVLGYCNVDTTVFQKEIGALKVD